MSLVVKGWVEPVLDAVSAMPLHTRDCLIATLNKGVMTKEVNTESQRGVLHFGT